MTAQPDPVTSGGLLTHHFRSAVSHPGEAARALLAMLQARIAFRGCRALGARVRLYGRCFVDGRQGVEIGERVVVLGSTVRCEMSTHEGGRLKIGNRVVINYGTQITSHSLVHLGDDCKIGQYSIIMDCDWHDLDTPTHDGSHGEVRPVILQEGVWLGARVTILRGVTIGRGSVIGAGSVVAADIPEGVVAVGFPARVVRKLSFGAPQ